MRGKTKLTLTILATLVLGSSGGAQSVRRVVPKEAEKRAPPAVSVREEALVTKRLERDSTELQKVYDDKKFLDACTVLAASGEMFLADSARVARDGDKFAVTFNVVNEVSQEPGQYKQLVYAFDGKEAITYFNEQNDNYARVKPASGAAGKIKLPPWPPKWTPPKWTPPKEWPGSGGGTIGLGGGPEWDDWHEVSVECHPSLLCPIYSNKMRQEERASKTSPWIKQTRWILIHCGC